MIKNYTKKFFIFSILAGMLSLYSCGAGTLIKTDSIQKVKKSAIISVCGFKEVNLANSGDSIAVAISETARRDQYKTDAYFEYLKNKVMEKRTQMFPFKVANESEVVSRKSIQEMRTMEKGDFKAASGYPVVHYSDSETVLKFLKNEKDYDSAIVINALYNLEKTGASFAGFGNLNVRVETTISVYDKTGELFMQKGIDGKSKGKISTTIAGYSTEDLPKLCKEATDDAIDQFIAWSKEATAK